MIEELQPLAVAKLLAKMVEKDNSAQWHASSREITLWPKNTTYEKKKFQVLICAEIYTILLKISRA